MGVQSTYGFNMTAAIEGQLADDGDHDIIPMRNVEASASIAFGRGVKFGGTSDDAGCKLPSAETDKIAGITVHSHAYGVSPYGDLDSTGVKVGGILNVLRKGRIWVVAEDGCAPGDRLWVRAVGSTPPEYLGGLNNADDGTDTVDCTTQGVWLTTASAGGLAVLEVDFTNKP